MYTKMMRLPDLVTVEPVFAYSAVPIQQSIFASHVSKENIRKEVDSLTYRYYQSKRSKQHASTTSQVQKKEYTPSERVHVCMSREEYDALKEFILDYSLDPYCAHLVKIVANVSPYYGKE